MHEPAIVDRIVAQAREIRTAEWATLEDVHARCADFTARRIEAVLRSLETGVPGYTESGR